MITAKFCTCPDSCAVGAYANLCCDLLVRYIMKAKCYCHGIWVVNKNLFMKWVPGLHQGGHLSLNPLAHAILVVWLTCFQGPQHGRKKVFHCGFQSCLELAMMGNKCLGFIGILVEHPWTEFKKNNMRSMKMSICKFDRRNNFSLVKQAILLLFDSLLKAILTINRVSSQGKAKLGQLHQRFVCYMCHEVLHDDSS